MRTEVVQKNAVDSTNTEEKQIEGVDGDDRMAKEEIRRSGEEETLLGYVTIVASNLISATAMERDKILNDIEENFSALTDETVGALSQRKHALTEQVRANEQFSLNAFRHLDFSQSISKQKLLCASDRFRASFRVLLEEISVHHGTHLLDLPVYLLQVIAGYLPAETLISCRQVCQVLRAAVHGAVSSEVKCVIHVELKGYPYWNGSNTECEVTYLQGKPSSKTLGWSIQANSTYPSGVHVQLRVSERKLYSCSQFITLKCHLPEKPDGSGVVISATVPGYSLAKKVASSTGLSYNSPPLSINLTGNDLGVPSSSTLTGFHIDFSTTDYALPSNCPFRESK
ncbi:hypothetical protein Pelo_100 [Pelomyxa schiedti]|nr:hypothetical protein Pelo_100 [Pelomyxa schiedti]